MQEVMYVVGPTLVAVVVAAAGPGVALWLCGALAVLGAFGFRAAVRRAGLDEPVARGPRRGGRTLLADRSMVYALITGLCVVAALVTVDMVLIAWAREVRRPVMAGVLTAVWAAGSTVGGLVVGGLGGEVRFTRRMVLLALGLAALVPVLPPVASPSSVWLIALVLGVGGMAIAPAMAANNTRVGDLAPEGRAAEAFGWVSAFATAGSAVVLPLAGWLLDHVGPAAAAGASAAAAGLGALAAGRSARRSGWCRRATLLEGVPAVRLRVVGAGVAFAGGLFLAVQARINGGLGHVLRDGFLAALVSFGGGLALLLALVPTAAAGRAGLARLRSALRRGEIRWWHCTGGACGAFLVSAQGLTIASLGVAAFTVSVVGAQVISSLLVDRAGLGPARAQPFTWSRVTGAVAAVVAVGVAVSTEFGQPASLWPALLPAAAGAGLGWQQAANGLVREAARSTRVTTLVNFATGTAVLVAVAAVDVAVRGLPTAAPSSPWSYVGGALGVVAIATAVVAVRWSGVLLVGMGQVAGQLVGALAVDVVAPAGGGRLTAATVVGTVLTLLAVGVAALPDRRRSAAREPGAPAGGR